MKSKTILAFHLIGQILAQTAVVALLPDESKPYVQALVVIAGLIISFLDPSATLEKLGMSRQEFGARTKQ